METKPKITRSLRPILLVIVAVFVIFEIVALSPSSVEEHETVTKLSEIEAFQHSSDKTIARGIPSGRVPDYSVDQFNYVSTQEGQKQWKLNADQAFLYNAEKLVHARKVKALLYDIDDKVTIVTGLEAKYFMNQRDLEVFGDVRVTFADGFELRSEYLRYLPNEKLIKIPNEFSVTGGGQEKTGQSIHFESNGFEFLMAQSEINLPSNSKVTIQQPNSADGPTLIESDKSVIYRSRQLAKFTMYSERPAATRFVHITQPKLFARSRKADMQYADGSQQLRSMVLYDDVLVKETDPRKTLQQHHLRYATGGRADFDSQRNVIIMTQFPQLYENKDTVTGDMITLHRDSDTVEIEHSNAFSDGNKAP